MEERAGCLEELAALHRQRTDISLEMVAIKAAECEQDAAALRKRLRMKGVGVVPRRQLGGDGDKVGEVLAKARQRSAKMDALLNGLKEMDVSNAPQVIRALPPPARSPPRRSRSRSPWRIADTSSSWRREDEGLLQAEFLTGAAIADASYSTETSGLGRASVSAPNGEGGLAPLRMDLRPRSVGGDATTIALFDAIGPEAGMAVLPPPPSQVSPRELAPLSGRGVESGRRREGWRSDGAGGKIAVASPALHKAHLRTLDGAHSFGGPPPNDKTRGVQLMAVQQMDGQHGDVDARKLKLPAPVVTKRAHGNPMHQMQKSMSRIGPKISSTG